jgi:hypothetical protein
VKFAYADPPYFGNGKRRYPEHPEAGIWDTRQAHVSLVVKLCDEYPDGWALSCNPSDLRWLLGACPADTRTAAWVKTFHQIRRTSVQYAWEPVLWRGGRLDPVRKPMVRDWLSCVASRQKGTVGAKPQPFNDWILALLGYDPNQDQLDDLFPGSGGMMATLARQEIAL